MSEVEPLAGGAAPEASGPRPGDREPPRLGRGLTLALLCSAFVGVAAVLYVIVVAVAKPGSQDNLQALARGPMARLQVIDAAPPAPSTQFVDGAGRSVDLSAFRGKVVLLNLWATWCAPCRKEMPTLARLQAAYAGKPVTVVAVSMDTAADTGAAKAFLSEYPPLAFYQDAKYTFLSDLNPHPPGFPTTVIFDRHGRERAVMGGETDWASPQAKAVVDWVLSERERSAPPAASF
jgi:thiol-disulfide isomerase/thioredoxin